MYSKKMSFPYALLALWLLLAAVGDAKAKPTGKSTLVWYASETATNISRDSWSYLGPALDSNDSQVRIRIEACLSVADEVCDSYCSARLVYHEDGSFEYFSADHEEFFASLRYITRYLDAFQCTAATIMTCTSQQAFAEKCLQASEGQLYVMEQDLLDKIRLYQADNDIAATIRQWVLLDEVLAIHQHKKSENITANAAAFLTFLKENAYLGPTMWPVTNVNGVRGVFVDRDVYAGDILFAGHGVSLDPVLARSFLDGISRSDINRKPGGNLGWEPFFDLVAYIAVHTAIGEKSPIAPYVNLLKDTVDNGVWGWSNQELDSLGDKKFVTGLENIRQLQLDYFDLWGERLNFPRGVWNFERFQWAFHIVNSRNFGLQNGHTIIPFVDMFNHDAEKGQSLQIVRREEDGAILVMSIKHLRRGDEIFIKYSDSTDFAHLLYTYGFVPKHPSCPEHADPGTHAAFAHYYLCAKQIYT